MFVFGICVQVNTVSCHNCTPFADVFQPCRADETIIAKGKKKERWEVGKMSDAKTSYIVLENKVKVKKGNVDINTRLMEVGVSDKALRKIRKIQGKMAKEVKAILNEEKRS